MKKEKISDAVIRRLPRYYRYLDELHAKGIVRISSGSLGKRMGITASQIRQDLSCFGEFGQQGYGYNIMELRAEIGHILGVDDKRRLIVEDIVDTGITLNYLKKVFLSREPESLKICTLLDKPARRKVDLVPDYKLFEIPNEFVIGYGLDYNEDYRALKDVCVLAPWVYENK